MASRRADRIALALIFASSVAGAAPSSAVILATATGTENTSAPSPDPGWLNLGVRSVGSLGITYLGGGWVITAAHVGTSDVIFDGGPVIERIAATAVTLENSPGVNADLRLYRILSDPGVPDLAVSTGTPPVGAELLLMGRGTNRGGATSYMGYAGWNWAASQTKRWGTNRVAATGLDVVVSGSTTRSFATLFDYQVDVPLDTAFESQASVGDSGGAVFYDRPGVGWELVGVMHSIDGHMGQPPSTALDQNPTFSADLAYFAAEIATITAERACSDGTDDDGDGLVDYPDDPGCSSASDAFETDASLPCDNGFDDDSDGLRDTADPGCLGPEWALEDPKCDDGIDNDFDGGIDATGGPMGEPADTHCVGTPWRNAEKPGGRCGLGIELAVLAPLLERLRRRRRR